MTTIKRQLTIDLINININVDNDNAKIKNKHESGSLKLNIKDEKQKAEKDVIILGHQPMHLRNETQKTKRWHLPGSSLCINDRLKRITEKEVVTFIKQKYEDPRDRLNGPHNSESAWR